MYKQISIPTYLTKGYSVVGCYITLLFTCLHSPYPSSQTSSWSAHTCPHISWLSTNQPLTQHSMRADGTEFSLMESRMGATLDPLQHVMYEWGSMKTAAMEWMLAGYPRTEPCSSWIKQTLTCSALYLRLELPA